MANKSSAVSVLERIRELYKKNAEYGKKAAQVFASLRNDTSSQYYAPYASGKSNYTELTDFFGVDKFDDAFFTANDGLRSYYKLNANGIPQAPAKSSSAEEKAAYEYYKAVKADEYTKKLEDQWRAVQKYIYDGVNAGYDDATILNGIETDASAKYADLFDYDEKVQARQTPSTTRPVAYTKDYLQAVMYNARRGKRIGMTDYDYLPDLVDYYSSQNKPTLPVKSKTTTPPAIAKTTPPTTTTTGTAPVPVTTPNPQSAQAPVVVTPKPIVTPAPTPAPGPNPNPNYVPDLPVQEQNVPAQDTPAQNNSAYISPDAMKNGVKNASSAVMEKNYRDYQERIKSGEALTGDDLEYYNELEKVYGGSASTTHPETTSHPDVIQTQKSTHEWDSVLPSSFDSTIPFEGVYYGKGNIDLNSRTVVKNKDGSFSTEESFSFWDSKINKEVLLPLIVNKKRLTRNEAIKHYRKTNEYLGKFDTAEDADQYAEALHKRQEWYYTQDGNRPKSYGVNSVTKDKKSGKSSVTFYYYDESTGQKSVVEKGVTRNVTNAEVSEFFMLQQQAYWNELADNASVERYNALYDKFGKDLLSGIEKSAYEFYPGNGSDERQEYDTLLSLSESGVGLNEGQTRRLEELKKTYVGASTTGKKIIPAGVLASAGTSDVGMSNTSSLADKNKAWLDKYTSLVESEYVQKNSREALPSADELKRAASMADRLGISVEEYWKNIYNGTPEWLPELDRLSDRMNNPDLTTRVRDIKEVLVDYLSGSDVSDAEQTMMKEYDKSHKYLLGGYAYSAGNLQVSVVDGRKSLGQTAYNALKAADSPMMDKQENAALIYEIGNDMDAAFGKYIDLEQYYAANPERKAMMESFVAEQQRRETIQKQQQEKDVSDKLEIQHREAISALEAMARGDVLSENQQNIVRYMQSEPITKDDFNDPAYTEIEDVLFEETNMNAYGLDEWDPNLSFGDYRDAALNDILTVDIRMAKYAGMTLSEYYEKYPEMKKTPKELIQAGKQFSEQKWGVSGGFDLYGFLFGTSASDLTGSGIGTGEAIGKGAEVGVNRFGEGFVGFWHNYVTWKDEDTVKQWNRANYGTDRRSAGIDFDTAISNLKDPAEKQYWTALKAATKDVLDLPFNFADSETLNSLYSVKSNIKEIEEYIFKNATPEEFAAFQIASSVTENALSMATAAAVTSGTGFSYAGTAVGFGAPVAYQTSEAAQAAGFDHSTSNAIGLATTGISVWTEGLAFEKLTNPAFWEGAIRSVQQQVTKEGASLLKRFTSTVTQGALHLGEKLAGAALVESPQEFTENVLQDTFLNIVGVQNKGVGQILSDGAQAGAMALITSPLLSGQAKFYSMFRSKNAVQLEAGTEINLDTGEVSVPSAQEKSPEKIYKNGPEAPNVAQDTYAQDKEYTTAYSSNINASQINSEGESISPGQSKYFQNSQVRDDDGNLVVAYHGTTSKPFNSFNTVSQNEFGAHFGTKNSTERFLEKSSEGGNTYRVYLNIENPIRMPDIFGMYNSLYEYVEYVNGLKTTDELDFQSQKGLEGSEINTPQQLPINAEFGKLRNLILQAYAYAKNGLLDFHKDLIKKINETGQEYLKSLGYDGVQYTNVVEDAGSTSYIVFDSSQVKSVDNESPQKSPNIIEITPEMQEAAKGFMNKLAADMIQSGSDAISSIAGAISANEVVKAITKADFAQFDIQAMRDAHAAMQEAEADMSKANNELSAQQKKYVSAIQENVSAGQIIDPEQNRAMLDGIAKAKAVAEGASKAYKIVNDKFAKAKDALNQQFGAFIKSARAEAQKNAALAVQNSPETQNADIAPPVTAPAPRAESSVQNNGTNIPSESEGLYGPENGLKTQGADLAQGTNEAPISQQAEVQDEAQISGTSEDIVSRVKSWSDSQKKTTKDFITDFTDYSHPAKMVDDAVKEAGGDSSSKATLRMLVQDAAYLSDRASSMIDTALTSPTGEILDVSFAQAIQGDSGKRIKGKDADLFSDYLLAKHAISRQAQEKIVFPFDTQSFVSETEAAHPEFVEAAKDMHAWWNKFMQSWYVDTGFISKDTFDKWNKMYPDYVPTYRDVQNQTVGVKRGASGQQAHIKAATGSEKAIFDPIESMVRDIERVVNIVGKNNVGRAFVNAVKSTPGLEWIASPIETKAEQAPVSENPAEAVESTIEKVSQTLKQGGKNVVTVLMPDGKHQSMDVHNDLLYDMLVNMGKAVKYNGIIDAVGKVERTVAQLITGSNPLFALPNLARDFQQAVTTGSFASNIGTGALKWISSAFDYVVTHSDDYKTYQAMGSSNTRYQVRDKKTMLEQKNALFPGYVWHSGTKNAISALGEKAFNTVTMEAFNKTIENVTRFAEFKYGRFDKSTYEGRLAAAIASHNVTVNFRIHGRSQIVSDAMKIVPFINPSVQGLNKLASMFTKDQRGRLPARAAKYAVNALIGGALVGLSMLRLGTDDEKEAYGYLPDYIKLNYAIFPTGDTKYPFIRIPISQDPVYKAMYGLGLYAAGNIDNAPDGFTENLTSIAGNILTEANPVQGTVFRPFTDVASNTTWYDSPIVSPSLENLPTTMQYDETTADAFKAMSNMSQALSSTWLGKTIGIKALSPKAWEYIVKQYSGYFGQVVIPAISKDKTTGEIGGLKSAFDGALRRFTVNPVYTNDVTSAMYDNASLLEKNIASWKRTGTLPDFDSNLDKSAAFDAAQEAQALVSSKGAIGSAKDTISDLYNKIDSVTNSDLSQSEKDSIIQEMRMNIVRTAFTANTAYAEFAEKYLGKNVLSIMLGKNAVTDTPNAANTISSMYDADKDKAYMKTIQSLYDRTGDSYFVPGEPSYNWSDGGVKLTIPDEIKPYIEASYRLALESGINSVTNWDTMTDEQAKSKMESIRSKAATAAKNRALEELKKLGK